MKARAGEKLRNWGETSVGTQAQSILGFNTASTSVEKRKNLTSVRRSVFSNRLNGKAKRSKRRRRSWSEPTILCISKVAGL